MEILVVDDNVGDVVLTTEALKSTGIPTRVSTASDGLEAIELLQRKGKFSSMPKPDLVLLDINMPRKNGHEMLKEVRQREEFRGLPIVIFTSSEAQDDIRRSYELGANCFVTKPVDLDDMVKAIHAVVHFWTSYAKLPKAT